ncbi:MAG: hypothetical protein LBV58_00740 [Acholeplasmatales bacterium]|jgi:putative exporter of polyketide antibiotics|nr:hypothetical protein [Acholeplasmatales bacterium]
MILRILIAFLVIFALLSIYLVAYILNKKSDTEEDLIAKQAARNCSICITSGKICFGKENEEK